MALYNGYGTLLELKDEKNNALHSINVEYERANGASYFLCRIPKYSVSGKRLSPKIALTSADGAVNGKKVSALTFAERKKAVFTMNAGLFNVTSVQPVGQTVIDGVSVTNTPMTDDNGTPISDAECYPLCIDADGVLSAPYSRSVDTADMIADGVKYAVTGWGKLIDNFEKCDETVFNEIVHPGDYMQQCIGQYDNGDYCVLTVNKARNGQAENDIGMTYGEMADILIAKGVEFAYVLDGGGSAETVLGNRQINAIYEGDTGRAVPTVIYFEVESDADTEDVSINSIYFAADILDKMLKEILK